MNNSAPRIAPREGLIDEVAAALGELRAALRHAKQLIEVGEVLRVEPQPHGRRTPTPQGAAVEGAAEQAPKEGVL